jgi:hypothetical protein
VPRRHQADRRLAPLSRRPPIPRPAPPMTKLRHTRASPLPPAPRSRAAFPRFLGGGRRCGGRAWAGALRSADSGGPARSSSCRPRTRRALRSRAGGGWGRSAPGTKASPVSPLLPRLAEGPRRAAGASGELDSEGRRGRVYVAARSSVSPSFGFNVGARRQSRQPGLAGCSRAHRVQPWHARGGRDPPSRKSCRQRAEARMWACIVRPRNTPATSRSCVPLHITIVSPPPARGS